MLQLVTKLLHIVSEVKHQASRQVLFSLLAILLGGQPRQSDLLWFGQYIAATLPVPLVNEKNLTLREGDSEKEGEGEHILLRNRCLQLMHTLLFTPRNTVSLMVCDEVVKTLGFDWVLLFLQAHLHPATVVWGLRIIIVLCSSPALMNR